MATINEITPPITPPKPIKNLFLFSKSNYPNHITPTLPSPHTFSESMMQENIEESETMITKWDTTSHSTEKFISLFQENKRDAKEFVKCVNNLRRAMHFLITEHSTSNKLVQANKLMKIAMLRLEKEFHQILLANMKILNHESVSSLSSSEDEFNHIGSDEEIQTIKKEHTISDLKLIAESMISSGYTKECLKIYIITRKSILDEELYNLETQSFTSSQINRIGSGSHELQINKWIDAVRISVKTLFRGEKQLCDHVFSLSETIKQTCVAQITIEGATTLFKFPELVMKKNQSPDKIFHQIKMYEALSDLWQEIDSIFSYESLSGVKLQALSTLNKLSDSIRTLISEFVSSIQKNQSKNRVPGGAIHPLTFLVMNYVSLLGEKSEILSDILITEEQNETEKSYFVTTTTQTSPASSRLAWIILVLFCKLDRKAELYNDVALSYLFLANNLQFVVEKVSTCSLKFLLGQDWLNELQNKVKLYAEKYETLAWGKVYSCLLSNNISRFESVFEEAYMKQRSWVVPDSKLREEIKGSIERKLVPAYREFYDSNSGVEKNLVKISPDDLGKCLSELFGRAEVLGGSSSSRSKISRCI